MRRLLLASCLLLAAAPAFAQSQRVSMSRPVAAMAQGCMADCLAGAGPAAGATPYTARICQLRCDASARFNAAQVQPAQANTQPGRRGRQPVQLVAAAMAPSNMPVSVIYTAAAPARGFGLIAGERDRLRAFREAEDQCRTTGAGCRLLMESPAACAAVAHATRRHQYALVVTSDPSTWTVTNMAGGFGPTQAVAEANALADCRSRDTGATCRIAAARCGAGQS